MLQYDGAVKDALFLQYLMALAMVKAIRQEYHPSFPVYIKWPNDIYLDVSVGTAHGSHLGGDVHKEHAQGDLIGNRNEVIDGNTFQRKIASKKLVKIGGILVNTNIYGRAWTLIVGCGLNVTNSLPTASIQQVLHQFHEHGKLERMPEISLESLLARTMASLDELYPAFLQRGLSSFESEYYQYWIHSGQRVHLQSDVETSLGCMEGEHVVVIQAVSEEGYLRTREVGTGAIVDLLPGNNTFQLTEGMIVRRKPS